MTTSLTPKTWPTPLHVATWFCGSALSTVRERDALRARAEGTQQEREERRERQGRREAAAR